MDDYENLERFNGLWCVFPSNRTTTVHLATIYVLDAIQIWRVEEIGVRFGGVPYIRFRSKHNPKRVIEVLGGWSIQKEKLKEF